MQMDIKSWLEAIGFKDKVAEERFLKPPALPYIVFTDDKDISGADDKNCLADRNISIELYSVKIDHVSETLIENLLNEKVIKYKKNRVWIQSEMFFETRYDFNLIEKF